MYQNNMEVWKFPEPVKKVKIKIDNLIVIGCTEKRPVEDVLNFAIPKSAGK